MNTLNKVLIVAGLVWFGLFIDNVKKINNPYNILCI